MMIRRAACIPSRQLHRWSAGYIDEQGYAVCPYCKQRERDVMADYHRRKYRGRTHSGKGKG